MFKYILALALIQVTHDSAPCLATEQVAFKTPRSHIIDVQDSVSQRTYPLFIKLPRSYRVNEQNKYPVIYLTDAWYAFQIVSGATRFPMNFGKMEESIIAGISYSKGSHGSSNRERDYTPSHDKNWRMLTGQAREHMDFIEKDVFSYIEKNYRADPFDRTFVGNSFGGLFGTYILLNNPSMFKNYVLGSPSYWWDQRMIFDLESKVPNKKSTIAANVFIAVGELETKKNGHNDMVKDAIEFHSRLLAWNQPRLKTKLMIIPEASHETAFPTTAIQGLYWLYKK